MNSAMWKEWVPLARRCLLVIESWLVALFGTVISIGCVLVPPAIRSDHTTQHTDTESLIFYTALWFVAFLEFCSVYWTWKSIAKKLYPVGFSIALLQPKWKWGLRYPISLWWGIKFLFGVMLLFMFHVGSFQDGGTSESPDFVTTMMLVLVVAHLTFGSLMLALGCYVSHEHLASIWKKRFIIELCVAGAASALKWAASHGP